MEPNTDHHEALRRRIKQEGLSDVYVLVPVRAEDLGTEWVREGEVDSIITVSSFSSLFVYFANGVHFTHTFEALSRGSAGKIEADFKADPMPLFCR